MAARPSRGCLAAASLVLILVSAGCAERDPRGSAAAQRRELVRSAKAATRAYNPATTPYGVYTGRAAGGGPVRLRVSARRRVGFSIRFSCPGRSLRAFPDHPPRLRQGGAFHYTERAHRYRLRVSGQVGVVSAQGRLVLRARPARGRRCRAHTTWRAALR
jgi:hypothetical protein